MAEHAIEAGRIASDKTAAATADSIAVGKTVESPEIIEIPPAVHAANLLKTIDDNPGLRESAVRILAACADGRREEVALLEEVEVSLKASGDMPVQPISSIVALLVRSGALVESLEVDGQPYAGTVEDAFEDECISEEATVLIYESLTECGRIVASELEPTRRAAALFAEKAQYEGALLRTLELCAVEGGLSTKQLEVELDADGFLYRDERTNVPHVYPSMYANFLKDVGCIEWHHAWITTDLGRQIAGL